MLHREAFLGISEFGEVLNVVVTESTQSKGISRVFGTFRVFNPGRIFGLNMSFSVAKGVVANQISKEIFWIQNFLEERDWRLRLEEYDDFCSNRL